MSNYAKQSAITAFNPSDKKEHIIVITREGIILAIQITGINELKFQHVKISPSGVLHIRNDDNLLVPLTDGEWNVIRRENLKLLKCEYSPIYQVVGVAAMQPEFEFETFDNDRTKAMEDACAAHEFKVGVDLGKRVLDVKYSVYVNALMMPTKANTVRDNGGYMGYVKGRLVRSLCLSQITVDIGYSTPLYINQLYISDIVVRNNNLIHKDRMNDIDCCEFAGKLVKSYKTLFPYKPECNNANDVFTYLNIIRRKVIDTFMDMFFQDMTDILEKGKYGYSLKAPNRIQGAAKNMNLLSNRLRGINTPLLSC
jgi:hypothetical protein